MSRFTFENPSGQQVSPEIKKTAVQVLDGHVSQVETIVTPLPDGPHETGCQEEVVALKDKLYQYQGITVDSKEDDLLGLISMAEGTPWVVEYFQQYIGADDESASWSRDLAHGYQQYRRILNFEIRVNSQLSYNYDGELAESELTGDGTIYPFIHPNQHDVFIADIGDGRTALIEIDEIKRNSHRKNSTYEISYHVRDYLTEDMHRNLIEKTVDTYVFDRNRLMAGANPFVENEEYGKLSEIEKYLLRIPQAYYNHFFREEMMTFVVPLGLPYNIYDVKQVQFINAIFDKSEFPKYRHLRLQRVDHIEDSRVTSIWDAIVQRDWYLIDEAYTKFNLIDSQHVAGPQLMFNGSVSLFHYYIYPHWQNPYVIPLQYNPRFTAPAELPIFIEEDVTSNRRYIYPVGQNNDYVFSDYFYQEDTQKMSRLELQVYNYLNHKPICVKEIHRLLQASMRWDDLDRYYYQPILYLLGNALLLGLGE